MAIAQLLVERGSLKDQSEDWGVWRFAALPSPADRLTVARDGGTHYLTVLCVHHRIEPADAEVEPSACVVAKWTGCA
ncbi:MAG TPA: hypothetical protein VEZ70_09540 [Allosphingosinicella sp.]|nr:hypothetical protein [Allosphingosinicella sp.]